MEEIIRPVAFLFSLGSGLLSGGLFASGGGFSRGAGLFFYFLQTGGFACGAILTRSCPLSSAS